MLLYITQQGSKISNESGLIIIHQPEGVVRKIPKEQVESISIFGSVQITSDTVRHCMTRDIPISYYSKKGEYFGRIFTTTNNNIFRLKKR